MSWPSEPHVSRRSAGLWTGFSKETAVRIETFLYRPCLRSSDLTPHPSSTIPPSMCCRPWNLPTETITTATSKGWVTGKGCPASFSTSSVKTCLSWGSNPSLNRLRSLGFRDLGVRRFYGPSWPLGSADVSLWRMVNAYRVLANEGSGVNPDSRWTDASPASRGLFKRSGLSCFGHPVRARPRSISFGFENPLATRFWTAVKTGTSKDMRDNWCVGYSKGYTVGVWIGNFSGRPCGMSAV